MAIIQSGIGTAPTQWTIDSGSNAGRVTLYDSHGNELTGIGVLYSLNNILDSLGETVCLTLSGQANTSIQVRGTSGPLTVSFQANIDGYNWFAINVIPLNGSMPISSTTSDGVWFVDSSGFNQVQAIITSYGSGNTVVSMIADPEPRDFAQVTITGAVTTIGEYADNTPNTSDKLPVLPAVASASAPSWTDGYKVPLSVDDGGNLRITGTFTTDKAGHSSITEVAAATVSTSILASNANRVMATIFNATNKTMYVALASTASLSAYTLQIVQNSYYELPASYTGAISAIWANGVSGNAMITELTP
jgi:hypothetical protein